MRKIRNADNSIQVVLTAEEHEVFKAVQSLNGQGRTTNLSQVHREAHDPWISKGHIQVALFVLESLGWIKDVSKGAAYHWRVTKEGESALYRVQLRDGTVTA